MTLTNEMRAQAYRELADKMEEDNAAIAYVLREEANIRDSPRIEKEVHVVMEKPYGATEYSQPLMVFFNKDEAEKLANRFIDAKVVSSKLDYDIREFHQVFEIEE